MMSDTLTDSKDTWYYRQAYTYIDDFVLEACRNEGSSHFVAAVARMETLLRKAGDHAITQHDSAT